MTTWCMFCVYCVRVYTYSIYVCMYLYIERSLVMQDISSVVFPNDCVAIDGVRKLQR